VRNGRIRRRGGRREQNHSPLPRKEPHRGGGETSLRRWKKPNKKKPYLRKERRAFLGDDALSLYLNSHLSPSHNFLYLHLNMS
jgi:hypothetical protein